MLDQQALETLFINARTHHAWLDKAVTNGQLREIYELMKWAPTAFNSAPVRIAFVKSPEAKARLAACMSDDYKQSVLSAPVTAIIGMDMAFPRKLAQLSPDGKAAAWFEKHEDRIAESALRNSSLQGGYFIIAARALGLDCGPMWDFDGEQIDQAFFVGTKVKANFVCSLGYGDHEKLQPRLRRLTFDASCAIVL